MTDEKTFHTSLIAALAGVGFFATGPTIIAGTDLNGLGTGFWRIWLSFVVITGIVAIRGDLNVAVFRHTLLPGVSFGLSTSMFFTSVQLTSVANATLITVLQPVPLLIAGRLFFKEPIERRDVGWITLAVAGAATMVLSAASAETGDLGGDLLAVGALIALAAYLSTAKAARRTLATLPFMAGLWMWAGLTLTPILLISGNAIVPTEQTDWIKIVAIAALPGMGHILINYSHRGLRLAVLGLIQLLTPVGSALLALAFLGQTVTWLQVTGMAVVLVALTAHLRAGEGGREDRTARPDDPDLDPAPGS